MIRIVLVSDQKSQGAALSTGTIERSDLESRIIKPIARELQCQISSMMLFSMLIPSNSTNRDL